MEQIGARELRANLAAVLRQAQAGERVIITVDGRPLAQLGPIDPWGAPTLAELAASGLVDPPRRADQPDPPDALDTPVDVRLDRVLDEVRRGMTIYVDTSALVRRYVHDRHRSIVLDAMSADPAWCASALVRSETQLALHRASVTSRQHDELWRSVRDEWEGFWVIPLDDRCMARSVEIGATYGVRMVDAIHLAAASRLPGPIRYLTFDRQQIPAAAALGFEVLSAVEP